MVIFHLERIHIGILVRFEEMSECWAFISLLFIVSIIDHAVIGNHDLTYVFKELVRSAGSFYQGTGMSKAKCTLTKIFVLVK